MEELPVIIGGVRYARPEKVVIAEDDRIIATFYAQEGVSQYDEELYYGQARDEVVQALIRAGVPIEDKRK